MNPKVAICVPTVGTCDAFFAKDLAQMVGTHAGRWIGEMHLIFRQGSLLTRVRENCVLHALQDEEVTHILFLDSDMRFPPDTIERLLKHEKPVVAANCSKRVRPCEPTAFVLADRETGAIEKVYPDPKYKGLQRVIGVGTAVMMIERSVFEKLERPWFDTPWLKNKDGGLSLLNEDAYFCGACDAKDIPIYIDHDLSWDVRHIGDHEYSMQDTLDDRDLVEEELKIVPL